MSKPTASSINPKPYDLEPNVEAAGQIIEQARVAGLLIGKGGLYGNVLRIAPPMTVTEAEIDEAGDILVDCIKALD